jgi:general secretion pathway protein G
MNRRTPKRANQTNEPAARGQEEPPAMDANAKTFRSPRGFTLVEMLVVIVIIGVLAGLVTTAAMAAIRRAKQFTIVSEMQQLTMALEKYKQERGDYPPDFAGVNHPVQATREAAQDRVIRHLRIAFPRYRPGAPSGSTAARPWDRFRDDVQQTTANRLDVNMLDPSSALVFWLGGLPDRSGSTKLAGFSANPANPFHVSEDDNLNGTLDSGEDVNGNGRLDGAGSRLPVLFEFDETRLEDAGDGIYRYIPPYMPTTPSAGATKAPFVYFRANPGAVAAQAYNPLVASFPQPNPATPIDTGTCVPYANAGSVSGATVTVTGWFNPKTFQIISAGLDGEFSDPTGTRAIPPDGEYDEKGRLLAGADSNLSSAEDDNLANFAQGTLADEVK